MGKMLAVFLKFAYSEEEALKNMDRCYNMLFDEECSPADKPYIFDACHQLYKEWECVKDKYICHPKQRFYKDKIRLKQKTYDREVDTEEKFCLNELSDTDNHGRGLYFIYTVGMVGGVPICAVKVGQTDDVARRMSNYRTHTPFVQYDGAFLSIPCAPMNRAEYNCYRFLNNYNVKEISACGEWVIVTEEDMHFLRELFMDGQSFEAIASGEEEE